MRSTLATIAAAAVILTTAASAEQGSARGDRPVLPASLGTLHHSIATRSRDAQQLFDEGLTLFYGFNRDAARRSFAAAAQIDAGAAMPHVGVALALGPNLNVDATAAEVQSACKASRQGAALAVDSAERGYADALAARYCDASGARLNGDAYSAAMRALHEHLPQDPDAAVLYADSLFALRPRTEEQDAEIVAVLESVLRRQPDHVGANHYYIHAVEGTRTPERGLNSAKRLETLVPGIGHLLHMPSHIYMRTGGYGAAIALNRRAAAADLAYLRNNPPSHDGAMSYFHDLESLAVAAGYAGRYEDARLAALEIARVEAELQGERPGSRFSGPLAAVQLRFQRWSDIAATPLPQPADAPATALARFARAVAFAATGDRDRAKQEMDECVVAWNKIPADAFYRGNPVPAVRAVFEAVLAARLAAPVSGPAASVPLWERAVAAQDRLRYHEPPPFYYSVRESLGAALLAADRPVDAARVFQEELLQHPHSARALFGLWHARRTTATAEAERIHREFLDAWAGSDVTLSLKDF